MNPPKSHELDYIHFLIAAQKAFTFTELPDVIPGMMVYHHRHHPTTLLPGCCAGILQTLKRYGESGRFVEKKEGELLVLDDTTRRSTSHTQRRWTLSRTISNTHEIEGILGTWCSRFCTHRKKLRCKYGLSYS